MEDYGVPLMSTDVYRTLSLLRPFDIDRAKVMVGNRRDGGYVLADLATQSDLLSFGISNDVGFEMDMAGRGHRCFLYDHTIEGLPDTHALFHYDKLGIRGSAESAPDLLPLNAFVDRIDNGGRDMILKIDVEGAEWDVFATIDPATLGRFEQISGEFHWLHRLDEPEFRATAYAALKAITDQFTLFHVHANNCRQLGFVGGFAAADVLELSFVRTDLVTRRPSETLYPSALNMGNNPVVHDHALLFFPFLPERTEPTVIDSKVAQIASEHLIWVR